MRSLVATDLDGTLLRTDGTVSDRKVRVRGLTMERSLTLVHCEDLDRGERRTLRLDRIEKATLEA